jgi:hypothetical protein
MGRNIYEEMAEFWPVSDDEYAEPMNTIPKVVFSRSLERVSRTRSFIRSSPETPLPSPFKPGLTTCAPDNGRGAEGVRDDRGRGVATRGGRELRGLLGRLRAGCVAVSGAWCLQKPQEFGGKRLHSVGELVHDVIPRPTPSNAAAQGDGGDAGARGAPQRADRLG